MSAEPVVSVIVPTCDRLPMLRDAIASVRAQSFEAWELVVVDDGSADGTAAWVESLGDPRIRLLRLAHSGNVGQVRNAGAVVADGSWLAFLDSDDLWLPDKLRTQLHLMRGPDARWSYTRYEHVDADGHPAPWARGRWQGPSGWIGEAVVSGEATVIVPTLMVERALFETVGGFATAPWPMHEDVHFVVRLALAAPASVIGEALTQVRRHGARSTGGADGWARTAATCDALLAEVGDPRLRRLLRGRRARATVEVGRQRLGAGDYAAGFRAFATALRDAPDPLHWAKAMAGGLLGRGRLPRPGPSPHERPRSVPAP